MNYYKRKNKRNILPMRQRLSVQQLSGQKRDVRMEYRLPSNLKSIIEKVAAEKGKSAADLHILLWLDYLAKANYIEGKVVNPTAQELKEDVEHFLKYA